MKKNTAKILIAVLCLMMAIGIATGSTFAWFSMNNKVLVTGMTVTTKVSNNLLIAETNAEANYDISLDQTRAATLEPASSVNGVNFWYTSTTNVVASGDAKTDSYTAYDEASGTALANANAGKTKYDAAFNTAYGFNDPSVGYKTVAYAYVDYSFYLKGTNADSAAGKIYMSKCNLLYNGAAPTDKAYRVAVFAKESAKDTTTSDEVAAGNLVTVLSWSDAEYFSNNTTPDSNYAISANAAPSTAVTNLREAAVISDSIASGETVYYKVTVRLWLEGEDTTCNNDTYAALTSDWTLDLEFKLDGSYASAVEDLDDAAAVASLTAPANIATAALLNGDLQPLKGEVASTYAFYNADGTAITNGSDDFSISGNALTNEGAARAVYCVITTTKGNTYRTPTITLAAPTP